MPNLLRLDFGRDIKVLITSMGIVSLAGGFNQVTQYVYLSMLGISPGLIGILVSVGDKLQKLSIIGIIDGFGSGMIYPLFSLWFYLRFGVSVAGLGYIFAVSKIFETAAYLFGPTVADRLGLVKAVTFARWGGAISVVIMAFMPTYFLAAVMFTLRNASQHLANPLRHSYMVAIFSRAERASAAGISESFRTAGSTAASTISGYIMQNLGTTISPLVSGVFIGIAIQLYYSFMKDIKTPEEQAVK